MRSVNIAELKNRLSRYLTFAKGGEEIIIRDRNLPVAKLVPFFGDEGSEDELLLVAAGKMRLPKTPVRVEELLRIPTVRSIEVRVQFERIPQLFDGFAILPLQIQHAPKIRIDDE